MVTSGNVKELVASGADFGAGDAAVGGAAAVGAGAGTVTGGAGAKVGTAAAAGANVGATGAVDGAGAETASDFAAFGASVWNENGLGASDLKENGLLDPFLLDDWLEFEAVLLAVFAAVLVAVFAAVFAAVTDGVVIEVEVAVFGPGAGTETGATGATGATATGTGPVVTEPSAATEAAGVVTELLFEAVSGKSVD